MKIISKFKDYYDFFVDTPDLTRVWERHEKNTHFYSLNSLLNEFDSNNLYKELDTKITFPNLRYFNLPQDYKFVYLYVCGYKYVGVKNGSKYYWTFDSLPKELKEIIIKYYPRKEAPYFFEKPIATTNLNEIVKSPLIIIDFNIIINPKLSKYNVSTLIKPKDMYLMIYDFLAPKDVETDTNPKNIDRFTSKGFDKKTSFRNIK